MSSPLPSSRPESPAPAGWTRSDAWIVAGCVAIGLLLRLVFYRGVFVIDDFNYLRHAAELWKGSFNFADVLYWHGVRIVIFAPISLLFALVGASEASAVTWPLLASLITVVLVYRIALRIHGRPAAGLSAFLVAILPLAVEGSTRVLPETFINLLAALSAAAFLRAESGPGRRRWLVLSGAAFGLMPWAGHLGIVFGIFFACAILIRGRRSILGYWPLAVGGAGIICAILIVQWIESGNPFANIAVSRMILNVEQATPKPLYYLRLVAWPFASHGGVLYLSAVGIALALLRPRRGVVFVAAWFVATYAVLEFGSSSITQYRPLFKQARYLSMIALPGCVLAGIAVAEVRGMLTRNAGRRRSADVATAALLLALTLTATITLDRGSDWSARQRENLGAIARHVREHRDGVIYNVHWLWNTRVGFFLGYDDAHFPSGYTPYHAVRFESVDGDSRNRYVQTLEPGETMAPGILLLDEVLLDHSIGPRRIGLVGEGEIPIQLLHPPDTWPLIDRVSSVAIYEIPAGAIWPGPAAADGP